MSDLLLHFKKERDLLDKEQNRGSKKQNQERKVCGTESFSV